MLLFLICVVGVAVVLYARDQRQANAAPRAGEDHWHAAYTIAECGEFRPALTSAAQDRLGIHTHEDGLIHIEPFLDGAAGTNAKLRLFLDYVRVTLTDSLATFPDGTTWDEATAECDGSPAQIVVARWIDGQDAADGERPNEVLTEDFDGLRFRNDREAYTIALIAEDELDEIPVRPDIVEELNSASESPPSTRPTPPTTADGATTTSVVTDDVSVTTAPTGG
ncbi:MAG: hypothetical protein ACLGHT_03130 [Acidimicrobiia bacterium]